MNPTLASYLQPSSTPPMQYYMGLQAQQNAANSLFNAPVSVNTPSYSSTTSAYLPGTVPDITTNHIYQALMGLPPSATGGSNVAQQVQSAQNAANNPGGGIGGALGGGLMGAAIGAGVLPGVGTLVGGLLGAGVGAFAPGVLSNPQNAVVKGIQDIENNQGGNILPDAFKQLFGQQAAPNYKQVYENSFLGKMLPNHSILGNNNIPFLSGLTNPNTLGSVGFNIATNPYSLVPVGAEGELPQLTGEEAAGAGLSDTVKGLTGSADNAALTKAGGLARNQIAQNLGQDNYASLLQAAQKDPQLLDQFNSQFGDLVKQNPGQYINTTGLKIPGLNLPVVSSKAMNAVKNNSAVSTLNDLLSNNPYSSGFRQLFGELPAKSALKANHLVAPETVEQVDEAISKPMIENSINLTSYEKQLDQVENAYPMADLVKARQAIENPKLLEQGGVNMEAYNALVGLRNRLDSLYAENGIPVPEGLKRDNYFPQANVTSTMIRSDKPITTGMFVHPAYGPSYGSLTKNTGNQKFYTIGTLADAQKNPGILTNTETQQLEDISKQYNKPIVALHRNEQGDLFAHLPLTTDEALAAGIPRDPNAVSALRKSYRGAFSQVRDKQIVNNLQTLKTIAGEPLIRQIPLDESGSLLKDKSLLSDGQVFGKGPLNGFIVPKDIQSLVDQKMYLTPKVTNPILNPIGSFTNFIKQLQLLNPLYHPLHNLLPNSMLGGMAPTTSIGDIVGSLAPGTREKLLSDPTLQAAQKAGAEIGHVTDGLPSTSRLPDFLKKAIGFNNDYTQNVDTAMRLSMIKQNVAKGMSMPQAIKNTEKIFGTYSKLSPFEATYASKLFPFYQWMKNNTMLWAQHPQALSYWNGALNAMNESTAGHQMALNPANEQSKVKLPFQIGGKDIYLNPMLPFKDITEFSSNPLSFLEGRVNPAISTAAHLASNTDYFGNQIYNPNLPMGAQTKNILGMNLDPRLAYALGNLSLFTQPLAAPTTGNSGSLGIVNQLLGTKTSAIKPDSQAWSNYYAAKGVMDAMSKYAETHNAQGQTIPSGSTGSLLSYQQANPYNSSPSTMNYINNLLNAKYTYEDELWGGHFTKQGFVPATGVGLQKYQARQARQGLSRQRMFAKMNIREMMSRYLK